MFVDIGMVHAGEKLASWRLKRIPTHIPEGVTKLALGSLRGKNDTDTVRKVGYDTLMSDLYLSGIWMSTLNEPP